MKRLDIIGAIAATLALVGGLAVAVGYKTPAQVQAVLSDYGTRITVLEVTVQETHDWVKDLHDRMVK